MCTVSTFGWDTVTLRKQSSLPIHWALGKIRLNLLPRFKEPKIHPEKFLTVQILICTGKLVSLVGQFDQMSQICFLAELIHPFILGSNIQKIKTRICCYWQVVTELDCIKTRTDTGYFLVLCNGPCFTHTISRRSTLHNSLVAFPMPQLLFLFTFSSVSKDLQGTFLTMKRVLCGDLDSSTVSTGKNP